MFIFNIKGGKNKTNTIFESDTANIKINTLL